MADLLFRNRRLLALSVALILVAGFSSFSLLPRMEDPELTSRNAVVHTLFPGAKADRVEALVTKKVEDELREFEEVRTLESESRAGISTVTIELHDDISDVDEVWSRIRDVLGDVAPQLPDGAGEPEFESVDITAFTMIAGIAWVLPGEAEPAILRRAAEDLADLFRAVPGTEDAEIFGEAEEEILVSVDPAELASLGLTIEDVARVLRRSDAKVSAGSLRALDNDLLLEVEGELDSLSRLARIPVRNGPDGRFVRLGDVATIEKTVADPAPEAALLSGRPGVAVAARMQSGIRVDHWAADVRAELAAFERDLPRGLSLPILFDQSRHTEERLSGLFGNLFLGAGLVMLLVLLMMGWRSALLVGAALPLSVLMVFAGMRALGIPLHQMSVTGLIIALGLLIDTAIVMVDEVKHRLDAGETARASIRGSVRRLFVPLLGSTLTTVLAFMPIVLMPGGAGEFVGTMAVSVILALVSSLLIAMSIVPALAGILGVGRGKRRGLLVDGISIPWLARAYRSALGFLFRRPSVGLALALALPLAGFTQFGDLEEQFFPPADRNQFQVEIELPQNAPIEGTMRRAARAREILLERPGVAEVHWFAGVNAPKFYYNMVGSKERAGYYAQALVTLRSAEGATEEIRFAQEKLDAAFPDAIVLCRQLEQGPPFDAPIELRITGPDLDALRDLGDRIRVVMTEVPGVIHTRASLMDGRPKLLFRLDEEEARMAGIDNVGLALRLAGGLDGTIGGSVLEATEELPVRVRLARGSRIDQGRVASLDLDVAGDGRWVPLASLGEMELVPELASIPHRGGLRTNTVKGYIEAGMLPNAALEAFRARLARADIEIPAGYRVEYGGESAERDRAVGNLAGSVSVLAVLMVAVLVLSFGSFRMAGVVGGVAMLSAGLAFLALSLGGYPLGFMAIVGTMGLIGVAINDTIVVLSGIRRDADARAGDPDAVAGVVMANTRHILATTFTTMAGFAPLMLEGGGFWPLVAVTIGGGVTGATVLALIFAPSASLLLTRRAEAPAPSAVPAPAVA